MVATVIFICFFFTLVINMPIGVCIGISALVAIEFVPGAPGVMLIAKSVVMGGDSFPLIAIPMFILVGEIMQGGGLSSRIVGSAAHLVGNVKAGLAYINVLASMFFAAISGSSPATVAAIGSNMIPEMERYNYPRDFSTALTAASGTLGVMIPPSIPFIIYGITASQSIGALFLAGALPGLVFGLLYAITARIVLHKHETLTEPVDGKALLDKEKSQVARSLWGKFCQSSLWALFIPVVILGGIYSGIFTPTEAAGVAVFYTLFVSLVVYRELDWRLIPEILARTAVTSVVCLIMVVMAAGFGRLLTMEQVPGLVATFITSLTNNPIMIILLVNIFLLIVGMFMDTIASIIILTPILLPVMIKAGVDPIHFGVILTCNLAVGFCTPPLGANLFIASSISGLPLEKVVRAILPFMVAMITALVLVSYIPALSTWLPSLIKI